MPPRNPASHRIAGRIPDGRRCAAAARRAGPGSSAGQALVLGLFFVFACAGVLLLMFNTGRSVDEKLRITNAADAAAWSVATLEARALNYDAYANRAIVANQVAIAQAVSLVSWMHYFEHGVNNAGTLAGVASSWIYHPAEYPRLAQLLGTLTGSAYLSVWAGGSLRAIVSNLDLALGAIISMHDAVSVALAASQSVMHASLATGQAQGDLANALVQRIDPAMRASINPASHDFRSFTQVLGRNGPAGDGRGRLAAVVLRSRDDFTRERVWSIRGPNLPPLQRNVELKRRGGTELIGYDEWRAMDTLEHQGQRLRRWRWRWRRTPIAAGAASTAAEATPSAARGHHGGSYRDNATTAYLLAEPTLQRLDTLGARFSGLPPTRALRDLSPHASAVSGVTLRVAKPRAALRTSGGNSVVQPGGRLQQFDAPAPGGEMAALSRAEVFFAPPGARRDGKTERPSLYSPYWQARLASPTLADRGWAAAQQGGLVLP